MTERLTEITIQSVLEKFPGYKPRIISDNGGQYISKDFTKFIKTVELAHVRTSVNYPQSNGKIERFHRTIGAECLRMNSFITEEDTKVIIAKYIELYNNTRLHSAVNYLPPSARLNGTDVKWLAEKKEKESMPRKKERSTGFIKKD